MPFIQRYDLACFHVRGRCIVGADALGARRLFPVHGDLSDTAQPVQTERGLAYMKTPLRQRLWPLPPLPLRGRGKCIVRKKPFTILSWHCL